MISALLLSVFTVVTLNCENLFDCQHDSLKNDYDFLPTSEKHWTSKRYWNKINNIGREIIACGDNNHLPDIVFLTEVENDSVMRDLTKRSLMRNAGYEYIITDCDDERGIDVSILYQPLSFKLLHHESIQVPHTSVERPTRDILHITGTISNGDTLHLFAVHLPSRRNGEKETRPYRLRAIQQIISKLEQIPQNHKTIIAGDFNDYDNDTSVKLLELHGLINIKPKAKYNKNIFGTYKFRGKWGSLDHIIITQNLNRNIIDSFINDMDFLLQGEGDKLTPRRTYRGNFYQNGFSDHLPILVKINIL